MVLKGKVKTGLGNAKIWVKKIEDIFLKEKGIKLFHGTLNVELEQEYELEKCWIIQSKEYGGEQDVYVEECKLLGIKGYIVRSEKTAHKSNIIEIVSSFNLRKTFNLKDDDEIEIKVK